MERSIEGDGQAAQAVDLGADVERVGAVLAATQQRHAIVFAGLPLCRLRNDLAQFIALPEVSVNPVGISGKVTAEIAAAALIQLYPRRIVANATGRAMLDRRRAFLRWPVQQHAAGIDSGDQQQGTLDLLGLHAVSGHLDLLVDAAEVNEFALGPVVLG